MKLASRQAAAVNTGSQTRTLAFPLQRRTKTPLANRLAKSLQQGHQIRGKEASLPQIDKGACEHHFEVESLMLQELLILAPSLETRVHRLNPKLLEELLQDPAGIACKLARMKQLFPTADISKIVQSRPSILSDAEFDPLGNVAVKLHKTFPGEDVGQIVSCQPVLLVEDIDYILGELGRLLSRSDVASVLAKDPNLVNSISCNRGLWGAEEF